MIKNIKGMRKLFLLPICFFLIGCDNPNEQAHNNFDYQIKEYKIGKHTLYISYAYTRFKFAGIGEESGLIQTFYPGGAPIVADTLTLNELSLKDKQIRVNFKDINTVNDYNLKRGLYSENGLINSFKADKIVGQQYGLLYRTQSIANLNAYELWIEEDGNEVLSFIRCHKENPNDQSTNPQCSHNFANKNWSFEISYSRDLLPEWALIQKNVLELMQSFQTREAAHAYVHAQYLKTLPIQKGEAA